MVELRLPVMLQKGLMELGASGALAARLAVEELKLALAAIQHLLMVDSVALGQQVKLATLKIATMVAQLLLVPLPLVTTASPQCKEQKFALTILAPLLLALPALVGII